jgi:hypothetical protein
MGIYAMCDFFEACLAPCVRNPFVPVPVCVPVPENANVRKKSGTGTGTKGLRTHGAKQASKKSHMAWICKFKLW